MTRSQPSPSRADKHPLVDAATRLSKDLVELVGPELDNLRRLPEPTLTALRSEGLLQALLPRRLGGYQCDLETFFDIVLAIGKADGSVAWTYTVLCCASWMVSTFFTDDVADEVFNSGNPLCCAVMAPISIDATKVDGGILIKNARWTFNSGIHHAGWDVVGIATTSAEASAREMHIALIPTEDLEIIDDWHTVGLRATGSCSVVASNVFVPDKRIAAHSKILTADYPESSFTAPLYSLPVVPTVMMQMVLPSIAIARGAVEAFHDLSASRGIPSTLYRRQNEAAVTHMQFAEASAKIDAAEAIIRTAMRELEQAARAGDATPTLQRARMWRDVGFVAKLAWEATDLLASASGGSFVRETHRMNRCWRDAKVATSHAALCTATTFETYGRLSCGLASNSPLFPSD